MSARGVAAEFIADGLGLALLRIDLSGLMRTYISETEKNRRRQIAAVDPAGGILLLDGADALFGRRPELEAGHDRYANQAVTALRRQLDRCGGLGVVVTKRRLHFGVSDGGGCGSTRAGPGAGRGPVRPRKRAGKPEFVARAGGGWPVDSWPALRRVTAA